MLLHTETRRAGCVGRGVGFVPAMERRLLSVRLAPARTVWVRDEWRGTCPRFRLSDACQAR